MKNLGLAEYLPVFEEMQEFTSRRDEATEDEIWMLQHPPVYTLGLAGKPEHVLERNEIPVVHIDRGGQVTYHGPGQLILYLLLDLKRAKLGVRELVTRMEDSVIELLGRRGISAESRRDAPGVYVEGAKVAALGLRIRRGCSYHGLSLNVDMDLSPFSAINPCGYRGLAVTQTRDLGIADSAEELGCELIGILEEKL
ncbi:MAG: lipoyl(octanoyl) transferase LipB [Burkholderiales bacterium]|nr:lipoyl(octanoyl) transferase LipB [Burkholderiales bacterium]